MKDLILDPCPYFRYESEYEQYGEVVEERARNLIKTEDWSEWAAAYNERDELDAELIYQLAYRQACKQIYDEVANAFA